MHPQFVTETIAEQPLAIVVGFESRLSRLIAKLVEAQGLQVAYFPPAQVQNPANRNLFQSAYKVIWVNECSIKQDEDYQQIVNALELNRVDPVIVQPVITGLKSPTRKSEFGYEWAGQASQISEMILDLNRHFPRSQFIFGQDIIDSVNPKLSPLSFAAVNINKGEIYDPEITWFPQSAESFAALLPNLLFRPMSNGSFLIMGEGQVSTKLLQQLKSKYEQYHSVAVDLVSSPQVVKRVIPFSAAEETSGGTDNELLTEIARKLTKPAYSGMPRGVSQLEEQLSRPERAAAGATDYSRPPEVLPRRIIPPEPEPAAAQPPPGEPLIPVQVPAAQPPPEQEKPLVRKAPQKNLNVNDELQKIFSTTRSSQKVSRVKSKAKTEKRQHSKTKRRTALFWGGIASMGMALGVIVLVIVFSASQFFMKRALVSAMVEAGQQGQINIARNESWLNVDRTSRFLAWQANTYSNLFSSSIFSQAILYLEIADQMDTMAAAIEDTQSATQSLVLQVLGREQGSVTETAQRLQITADRAYENLSLLQAGFGQVNLSDKDQASQALLTQYSDKVREMRQGLIIAQQLNPHLGNLTGLNGKKTYALVLQNNQELRPTGGFIQSIALLNFERGSLVSYQVFSSYELDQKLTGTVTPPEDVAKYLGEETWYLRDSNWDPHFPASAAKISWFIEKSLGTTVDGVIGMNLITMESMIAALGPIELDEYNETLTDRNLQERMEFHSEVVLIPKDGVKDYSSVVLEKMIEKIKNIQEQKTGAFLTSLMKNLATQQLAITVFDEAAQDTFNSLGWNGGLINPLCPAQLSTENCKVDSIAQVEANVGVNKANYYLRRAIDHTISLGQNEAVHQRIISYENTAQSNSWPKGSYKSFIRFYMPLDASFISLSVDGVELPANQIVSRDENGKSVVGALFEVPVKTKKQMILEYSVPVSLETPLSYAFFNQKQAGTAQTPVTVKVVAPSSLQPAIIAPQAEVVDNTIIFADVNDKHSFVGVQFQ